MKRDRRIRAAQHGGEDRPVVFDPLQHRATFLDAYARSFGRVGAACVRARVSCLSPDRAVGVETDPVGSHVVGPHPAVREAAVGADVECRQPSAKDSEMMRVELSGVITIPFGKSISLATQRAVPSGVTSAMIPGSGGSPPRKSNPNPLT